MPALRTAIDGLRRIGVDGWLCAGDVVGYGPHPHECIETIAELGVVCVAGNHDLIAVGALDDGGAGPLARRSLRWTRNVLRVEHRAWLAALPRSIDGTDFVLAHGAPADPREYVRDRSRARELLEDLPGPDVRALVLGHTHRSWVCTTGATLVRAHDGRRDVTVRPDPGGPVLVNPGAVGQSRNLERRPLVRFAVVDTDRNEVRLRAEPYDPTATLRALRAVGLPAVVQRRPRPWRYVRRHARRAGAPRP
nr:metallophosphoesterase [Pseudonocardia sp. C8]